MKDLQTNILEWADDKDILYFANRLRQLEKTKEEITELEQEINQESDGKGIYNIKNIKLELGDVGVTLIILAEQLGVDFQDCIELAYEKIKNRTGKTINGTFVKDI